MHANKNKTHTTLQKTRFEKNIVLRSCLCFATFLGGARNISHSSFLFFFSNSNDLEKAQCSYNTTLSLQYMEVYGKPEGFWVINESLIDNSVDKQKLIQNIGKKNDKFLMEFL